MKKLLALLLVSPLTITACFMGADSGATRGTYTVELDALDGTESALYTEVHGLINGGVDYQWTNGSVIDDYSHAENIMKVIEYAEYYEANYTLDELVWYGHYTNESDVTASSINDVVLTSHGGPTMGNNATYFDRPGHTMHYIGTSNPSEHGQLTTDVNGNNPTDSYYFRTTMIDSSKTWGEHGLGTVTGTPDTNPIDGKTYEIIMAQDNGDTEGDNPLKTVFQESVINVSINQSQHLHYDEFTTKTKNGILSMEEIAEWNLKSIGIIEAATNKMAALVPNKDLHFASHSFGGILAPLYLTTMGYVNENVDSREFKFDTFISAASRLDFEDEVANTAGLGVGGQFMKDDGEYKYFGSNVEDYVRDLGYTYEYENGDYMSWGQWQKDAWDLLRNDYFGGMSKQHYLDRKRSTLLMQGHLVSMEFTEILKTYGGDHVKNHSYLAHGGIDESTGPLRTDERDAIQKHFKSEVFDAEMDHMVLHLFDFTVKNSYYDLYKPTSTHITEYAGT